VGTDVKPVIKASTEERNLGTAILSLTTNRKVEFASRASKREVTVLRQGERRNARQGDRADQKRRDMEAAKPTIIHCLVMLDLPSDKRRRSYTSQKVMRGHVWRQVLENPEVTIFWKNVPACTTDIPVSRESIESVRIIIDIDIAHAMPSPSHLKSNTRLSGMQSPGRNINYVQYR
jgi:hypothetical protein